MVFYIMTFYHPLRNSRPKFTDPETCGKLAPFNAGDISQSWRVQVHVPKNWRNSMLEMDGNDGWKWPISTYQFGGRPSENNPMGLRVSSSDDGIHAVNSGSMMVRHFNVKALKACLPTQMWVWTIAISNITCVHVCLKVGSIIISPLKLPRKRRSAPEFIEVVKLLSH